MRWTPNYNFPQWESEDVTTWKGQLNEAFEHLDSILYIIGHQTYASPADIEEVKNLISKLETETEGYGSTVEQVLIYLGRLNDRIDKYEADVNAKLCETTSLLQTYSFELHSTMARVELLEKEVAKIGSNLVKQYFPCMSGTTLPTKDEETEGGEGNGDADSADIADISR